MADHNQTMTHHVSANSASSSLRSLDSSSGIPEDAVRYVREEEVLVRRLDDVYGEVAGEAESVFLKVDAQGYERQVIDGAAQSLERIVGVQLELGLTPIYEGECVLEDMLRHMRMRGFVPYWIAQGFRNPKSQRLYQVDVCFFRD